MLQFTNQRNSAELISAKALMLCIGLLAFALPILLILTAVVLDGCELVQNSISAYYHTVSRNLFVGSICSIAFCLFAYKGYSDLDNLLANAASILALGVAFLPTSVSGPFTDCLQNAIDMKLIGKLHFISAGALFILLGIFSAFIFTKSGGNMTDSKRRRNLIFRVCGYLIFACIVLLTAYFLFLKDRFLNLADMRPVFWIETICLWSFAVSWLTKSGIILKD